MQDKVTREIERTGRNLLITNTVVVTLVCLALGSGYRYWYNFFLGPFPIDNKKLAAIKPHEEPMQYYVHVKGEKSMDTGIQEIKTRKNRRTKEVESETPSANYLLTSIDHKAMLVKAPVTTPGTATDFEGELRDLSADEREQLSEPFKKMGVTMLPVMLDIKDFKGLGYVGLLFGMVLLAVGIWNFRKYLMWKNEPEHHPLMKDLAKLGDVREMRTRLNDELNSAETISMGNFFLTKTWIGSKGTFDVRLVPLDNMLWVYKLRTKHSVNFVPTGSSFEVVIKTKDGKETKYSANEKNVDKLVSSVAERAPWIIAGYSDELSRAWSKNWRDFADGVEERKRSA